MNPADMERKAFVVEGIFFRFWKYQSDKTDLAGTSGQVSPLIMATALVPVDLQEKRLDFMLLIFVIVVIGGIAALIYSFRRADQKQKSPAEKILESLPDRIDVSGLND